MSVSDDTLKTPLEAWSEIYFREEWRRPTGHHIPTIPSQV